MQPATRTYLRSRRYQRSLRRRLDHHNTERARVYLASMRSMLKGEGRA